MSAFNQLTKFYLSPNMELPLLKRIGSANLGRGLFGSLPYRNLLRVGSASLGLVLVLGKRQLLIPWFLVASAQAPWGIFPREKWLLGEDKIPLIVPKGTVQYPD